MTSGELSQKLAAGNVLANGVGPQLIRFVTHLDVSREQCASALEAVAAVCARRAQA
jgi:acetylornithine/succinyldiaminopimelate/putrescine aminotransferase